MAENGVVADSVLGDVKVRRFPMVYHVGNLNGKRKPKGESFEGTMLSVSLDPGGWERIAQLGGYPTWALRRRDGRPGAFVDYHALGGEAKARLTRVAVERGLIKPVRAWVAAWFDEEVDDEVTMMLASKRAAKEQVNCECDEGECDCGIEEVQTYKGLKQLGPLAEEFAHLVLLEELCPHADGVWWTDEYGAWSAPRGGIFQRALPEWRWEGVDEADEVEEVVE